MPYHAPPNIAKCSGVAVQCSSPFAVEITILLIWTFNFSNWQAALAEVFKLKYADMAAQVNIPAHGIQTYLFQD